MGKVTITAQVEFSNEAEVALATELLKTIQQLTSNFDVRTVANTNKPASDATHSDRSKPAVAEALPVKGTSPQPQMPPAATAAPEPAPPPKVAPKPVFTFTIASTDKQMEELVRSMEDRSKHPAILQILHASLNEHRDKAFQLFFDAFIGNLFHSDPTKRPTDVEAYLSVLMELKDPWKDQARSPLTTRLLKQLTVKRPVDCDRRELLGHAEAFAVLVKFEVASQQYAYFDYHMEILILK